MLKQFDLIILNEFFKMKILKSTTRKIQLAAKANESPVLPYYVYYAAATTSSRKLCYIVQVVSFLILFSCTLVVYQAGLSSSGNSAVSYNSIDSNKYSNIPELLEFDNSNIVISGDVVVSSAVDNNRIVSEVSENDNTVSRDKSSSIILPTISNSRASEDLSNVFLSVKSTKRFHSSRLEPILQTWFNLARDEVRKLKN